MLINIVIANNWNLFESVTKVVYVVLFVCVFHILDGLD